MTERRLAWALLALAAFAVTAEAAEPKSGMVTAVLETEKVDEDPDDPAIWVNAEDPAQSRVLGTDKDYGLLVFDLEGKILQRFPDGRLNNVDLRADVLLAGGKVTLAAASKREDNTIVFYVMAPDGSFVHASPFAFPGSPTPIKNDIYGIGLYRDAEGQLSVVASFKTGDVVQWIVGGSRTALTLTFARRWMIPSQPEGVVADDGLGFLYIGEEDGGIWRFDADPAAPTTPTLIDHVGSACLPVDDVEGMGILDRGNGAGYLVVSAQGVNRYALYPRVPDWTSMEPCIGSFGIGTGPTDPVGETDGLDVVATPLGAKFPRGLMVVQDDRNEGFSRNFKYVSWADIEQALGLPR